SRHSAVVLRVLRGDGATVWVNGREVTRDPRLSPARRPAVLTEGPPAGAAAPVRRPVPAPQLPLLDPPGMPTPFFATVCLPRDLLRAGANVVAVEVRGRGGDADPSFDLELLGNDGPSLIRGPYLQIGTPTSAIVRWRTDCPAVGMVALGEG